MVNGNEALDREVVEMYAAHDRDLAALDGILGFEIAETFGDYDLDCDFNYIAILVWEAVARRVATGRFHLTVRDGRQCIEAAR